MDRLNWLTPKETNDAEQCIPGRTINQKLTPV
jgi:hypothetical protein